MSVHILTTTQAHMLRITAFMRIHEFDFYAYSFVFGVFFWFTMKRSWNLYISHASKWYILDPKHTYKATTFNGFFLSAILFIVFCCRLNRNFWPFEINRTHIHFFGVAVVVVGVVAMRCDFGSFFFSSYSLYDRHPSTI